MSDSSRPTSWWKETFEEICADPEFKVEGIPRNVLETLMVELQGQPISPKELADRFYEGDRQTLASAIRRLRVILATHNPTLRISKRRYKVVEDHKRPHTHEEGELPVRQADSIGSSPVESSNQPEVRSAHSLINAELGQYVGEWHSYHVTKDDESEFWSYAVLNFPPIGPATTGDRLTTTAAWMPREPDSNWDSVKTEKYKNDHSFDFAMSLIGGHLVIQTTKTGSPSDLSIGVFRDPRPHLTRPITGTMLLTDTWAGTPAVTKWILCKEKLSCDGGAPDGAPIRQQSVIQALLEIWTKSNKPEIDYLPSETIRANHKWKKPRFAELLGKVTRGKEGEAEEEEGDLRLVTTAFLSVSDLGFREVLKRNVRIKIILMNPDNAVLIAGRFGLRTDGIGPTAAIEDIKRQSESFKTLAEWPNRIKGCRGTLEVRTSDAMPCGFVAHSNEWAILGVMLAEGSYMDSPMIEMDGNSDCWDVLRSDWKSRWDAAKGQTLAKTALAAQHAKS